MYRLYAVAGETIGHLLYYAATVTLKFFKKRTQSTKQ